VPWNDPVMDVTEVMITGLDTFGAVLAQAEDLDRPSPCGGWSARAVVGHVLIGLDSVAATTRGESYDWSSAPDPTSVPGDDPLRAFEDRKHAALAGMEKTDLDAVLETPMGRMAVRERLAFPAMDLHLHAWDLGRAVGVQVEIPPAVAAFTHAVLDPLPAEMVRSERVFGPEVPAPADATPTEALVAWTGRNPR
jgi:uncharacterized protein (TIGR03086 family)